VKLFIIRKHFKYLWYLKKIKHTQKEKGQHNDLPYICCAFVCKIINIICIAASSSQDIVRWDF